MKQIPCIYFFLTLSKQLSQRFAIIAPLCSLRVSKSLTTSLPKKVGPILAGGLVEDSFGLLGLEPLHAPLNGRLAEVVGVRLHRQPVNAHHRMFLGGVAVAVRFIAPCHFQNPLSNIRLPGSVGFHKALDEGFRYVGINRQQLLCLAVYSNPDKSPIIGVYYAAIYFAGQL